MALTPTIKISADPFNRIPDSFPRMPESTMTENPELRKFQAELDDWYRELKLALKANFDLTK